jgi:hypothetical protein
MESGSGGGGVIRKSAELRQRFHVHQMESIARHIVAAEIAPTRSCHMVVV